MLIRQSWAVTESRPATTPLLSSVMEIWRRKHSQTRKHWAIKQLMLMHLQISLWRMKCWVEMIFVIFWLFLWNIETESVKLSPSMLIKIHQLDPQASLPADKVLFTNLTIQQFYSCIHMYNAALTNENSCWSFCRYSDHLLEGHNAFK